MLVAVQSMYINNVSGISMNKWSAPELRLECLLTEESKVDTLLT
jgi:hypothetical protein